MSNLKVTADLELVGRWTVRKFLKGNLQSLMEQGLSCRDAADLLELTGKMFGKQEGKNLITTAGKAAVAQAMIDASGQVGLTYFAIGTDNTAPTISDATLGTETARKVWSLTPIVAGTTAQYTVFFLSTECNFAIEEAGIFGISGATGSPDTGTLFSHYLVEEDNSSGDFDLTFDYDLEVL